MQYEDAFVKMLDDVDRFEIKGSELTFFDDDKSLAVLHERAGTHGMGSLIVVALGDDGAGEIADELQIPLGNGDGHGPFVNGLDLLDNRKRRHQRRTLRCIGAAFDGIYHILRRHRCAIMKQ